VSAVAFLEVALLAARDRIKLRTGVLGWRAALVASGFVEYVMDGKVAVRAAELELSDPFDRITVATAIENDCMLVTADAEILAWRGGLKRLDARK
jgi:PIN domain nuclease of toxin-antitoxin system